MITRIRAHIILHHLGGYQYTRARRRQDVELLMHSRDSLMSKAVIEAKRKPVRAPEAAAS